MNVNSSNQGGVDLREVVNVFAFRMFLNTPISRLRPGCAFPLKYALFGGADEANKEREG